VGYWICCGLVGLVGGGLKVHFLMEMDVVDAFFYGVFCDCDSGDVRAWFSYFFECFVALRLGFEVFLGVGGFVATMAH